MFEEHPNNHNLLGLSQMLSKYSVTCTGVKIEDKERFEISGIKTPCIAHFNTFIGIIYNITPKKVYIWSNQKIVFSHNTFKKKWSGILVLPVTKKNSIEPDYKINRFREQYYKISRLALFTTFVYILSNGFLSSHTNTNFSVIILTLINCIGIFVCSLLILKQVTKGNPLAERICSIFEQGDCNRILESKAAKPWGLISWSEIGLGYFVSNLLLISFNASLIPYLTLINITVLPYSFWSVWYQRIVVQQWCLLCLIIQGLLWGIFVTNILFGLIEIPSLEINELVKVCILYLSPMLIINLVVTNIDKNKRLQSINKRMNHIKADERVFLALLKKEPHFKANFMESKIIFGDPNAKLRISVLSNPHCPSCSKIHKVVDRIINSSENNILVQYYFVSFNKELEMSAKFLIYSYFNNNQPESIKIFSDWYRHGQYKKEKFYRKYGFSKTNTQIEQEFAEHNKWIKETKFEGTPTILVNGYMLPKAYSLEDLIYFTDLVIDAR
jgi:hypothetical protein